MVLVMSSVLVVKGDRTMLKTMLVPLDGSACAEHAIPIAARIARSSQGRIIFVRVVHAPAEIGFYGAETATAVEPTAVERHLAEANNYLTSILTIYRDDLKGIKIETDVEVGDTPSAIFSAARLEQADLIVMCSYRETGLKHWIFQSIAGQAIRSSPVSVLLLNVHRSMLPLLDSKHPLRMLVPLDGSMLAEAALEPAAQLAALLSPSGQGALHLLSVIDIPSSYGYMRGMYYIDAEIQERTRKDAEKYLASVIQRLQGGPLAHLKLTITASASVNTNVPGAIIKHAEQIDSSEHLRACDLIAMATHGRGGLRRLLLGSVTEHILGLTSLPLLVVRPQEQTDAKPATGSYHIMQVVHI
jgi:nucleotide-binding universal stress UspA family protein